MSETCVDDVIQEEGSRSPQRNTPKNGETKPRERRDSKAKAEGGGDGVPRLAPNQGKGPRGPRLSKNSQSNSGSFDNMEGPSGRHGSFGDNNRRRHKNSYNDNNFGPRPRYKSIDKSFAIDQHGGRRAQIWAREKSLGSCGGMSNGDSLDFDFELEEPFSDSDEDETSAAVRAKRATRPALKLPMPRRRIRSLSGTIPSTGYSPVWGGPTMCLGCLEFFDLPAQTQNYVTHLLDHHKIVISDIELIVDLKRYVEHWRHRFGNQKIEETFPTIVPDEDSELHGKVEYYYVMSEKVKEDRDLRERLALRRLEEVLACQQRERNDFTFTAQCLFCRYRARGNRSKMIHHLYMIHHLNLGSPENLVFFNEYMDLLKGKIDKNTCLYCEKTFQDHTVLMEHMRKRQHREVNPKNSYYDRFYVINYLELGKKWLEVLAEDFEDTMPTFVDSDDEDEEESWNEWQEDNVDDEETTTVVCLYCDDSFQTAKDFLAHSKEKHEVDLETELTSMEFYSRVKVINCMRKLSYNRVCFVCGMNDLQSWEAMRKHVADHSSKFPPKERYDTEEYLIPVFENDHLLWVLESHFEEAGKAENVNVNGKETGVNGTQHKTGESAGTNGEEEKTDGDNNGKSETKEAVVILPEDPPELVESIFDNDPDLVQQLK